MYRPGAPGGRDRCYDAGMVSERDRSELRRRREIAAREAALGASCAGRLARATATGGGAERIEAAVRSPEQRLLDRLATESFPAPASRYDALMRHLARLAPRTRGGR